MTLHGRGDWLRWPFLDDGHRRLVAELHEWIATYAEPQATAEGGTGEPAGRLYRQLAQDGWFSRALIRARSGLRNACLLRECLAYSSGIADVAFSEPWLAGLVLEQHGGEYLRRYLAGECLPAFALSEPGAGSDAAALSTTGRYDGEHVIVNGTKTWTSNAGLADAYVVFVRTEDGPGAGGISALVVDARTPGIELVERLRVLPPHTVGTLRFHDVAVPVDRVIGPRGQGFRVAMQALELFRPTVGAATVGFARRALDEALGRSLTRETFGKPISQHQLVQGKLATMATSVDAAALLVLRAAWLHDTTDEPLGRAGSIAKIFATEAAQQVVDDAVQIFGGLGITYGVPVERLYREVRAFRLFDGSTEVQKLIIAKAELAATSTDGRTAG